MPRYKKNSNQIRGSKGNKHYQSNKATSYMGVLVYYMVVVTNGLKTMQTTCMTAVGIDKQTVNSR
jgi:hypothetical protein